jgi:replicative DNA helicase
MMDIIAPEKMEPLVFKLLTTEPKYATILGSLYEKEWLNDPDLGKILEVVLKYFKAKDKLPKFNTIDLITSQLFPDNHSEIMIKLKAAQAIDLSEFDQDYLDEELLKYLRNGGICWAIMSNVDEIEATNNVEGMIDRLRSLTTMDFDLDLGFDYLEEIDEHCEILKNPEARLSTGWDELDKFMNGGWYRDGRCLGLFMGETHIGKSLMLSNLATNALKMDKFAVIITLEMSETVYGTRIDAHLTKTDINSLQHNTELVVSTANRIKDDYSNSKLIIKEFPPDSITCNNIKAYLDKITAFHQRAPDIVIVDYINLMLPADSTGSDNTYNKYRIVTTELRRLSYIINRPVVTVTQCNRGGFSSSEVSLDNTADSIAIPMIADFVGVLFQNEGDREAEILNLKLCKNRLGGRIGKVIQFHIDYSNLAISDISSQLQAPGQVAMDVMAELQSFVDGGCGIDEDEDEVEIIEDEVE